MSDRRCAGWIVLSLALLLAAPLRGLDLAKAERFELENGLTVLVLADPTQPLVSTQVTIRAGARNERVGATGVAHFLEHMAFRATERFPGTEVVSRIYQCGGEWHAYTWTDETAYFETVPKEQLDLVLAIQADRLARLQLPPEDLEAERGAVMAELRSYEESPAIALWDAVLAVSFLQHPYRYNTIGWPSDVLAITHEDVLDFYRRAYSPGNAVLAVVGDVSVDEVLEQVRQQSGVLPAGQRLLPPPTREPPQTGVRRIDLSGEGNRFLIAYRAPPSSDPDAAPFLLLQALLGGSEGVSFLQQDGGNPVEEGTRLAELGLEMTTWYPASAAPYVFTIGGAAPGLDRRSVEEAIETRIAALRETEISANELAELRYEVLAELQYDVETTEDAAHQLSFFAALDGLEALLDLPRHLREVTSAELARVASKYLRPEQRTIGWIGTPPGRATAIEPLVRSDSLWSGPRMSPGEQPQSRAIGAPMGPPIVARLASGLPLLIQQSQRSSTGHVRLLLAGPAAPEGLDVELDAPVWRHTSLGARFVAGGLLQALYEVRSALGAAAGPRRPEPRGDSFEDRLEGALWETTLPASIGPVALAVAGDVSPEEVRLAAERIFGAQRSAQRLPRARARAAVAMVTEAESGPLHRLGWGAAIPAADTSDGLAARLVLWILSHGYEGRLGRRAVHDRGLVYSVDPAVLDDGRMAWVQVTAAVEPPQLEPLRALFRSEMDRLLAEPPSDQELRWARAALIGRRVTAAQSPAELTAQLVRDWVELGGPTSPTELENRLARVGSREIARALAHFRNDAANGR